MKDQGKTKVVFSAKSKMDSFVWKKNIYVFYLTFQIERYNSLNKANLWVLHFTDKKLSVNEL